MIELVNHRAYEQIAWLKDLVVEYVVLQNDTRQSSPASHKKAAVSGMRVLASRLDKYFDDLIHTNPRYQHNSRDDFFQITWDESEMSAMPYDTAWLFSPCYLQDDRIICGYAHAFMNPPCPHTYAIEHFNRLNETLFTPPPAATTQAYKWNTTWSNYFNAGLEWWGAYYWTVYDMKADTFVVIAASSTDQRDLDF